MKIFTIGFTKKSAEEFFTLLKNPDIHRLVDIRLNNVSQLAGFTKRDDLRYFLKAICNIDYVHAPLLAPTKTMLDAYKKNGGDWASYEAAFLNLIRERQIERSTSKELLANACLLCSEAKPDHCHRRLVAEYLEEKWGNVTVTHL
ncbi:MAG: DUF488 family protein [Candidatus Acidiferrales bacterium]